MKVLKYRYSQNMRYHKSRRGPYFQQRKIELSRNSYHLIFVGKPESLTLASVIFLHVCLASRAALPASIPGIQNVASAAGNGIRREGKWWGIILFIHKRCSYAFLWIGVWVDFRKSRFFVLLLFVWSTTNVAAYM